MTGDAPSGVAAIVLAAGQGTRFAAASGGAFKLLASLRGAPLVRHVADAASRSRASPIVVVTGHEAAGVRDALHGLPVTFAHNDRYASGLSSSLRTGIAHVPDAADGALILLADMPLVSPALLDALIIAFEGDRNCDAVVPVHRGQRGNPVLLGRALFDAAMRTQGDAGARKLLARSAHVIEIEAADQAVSIDVDVPDVLVQLT